MYFYTLEEAKEYLINKGGYSDAGQLSREYYRTFHEYEHRIFTMANRVSACMKKYPKEIYAFLRQHPEKEQYSLEELNDMTYVELSTLRKELGIRSRKNAKKVTQVEAAPVLAEKGRQNFAAKDDATAAKTVALYHVQESVKEAAENMTMYHDSEQILTEQEIICMYGEELPSLEFLIDHGIYPENVEEYKKKLKY